MDNKRAIGLFQKKIEKIEELRELGKDSAEFSKWKSSTITLISKVFGITRPHDFKTIQYSSAVIRMGDKDDPRIKQTYVNGLMKAKGILEAFVEELEIFDTDGDPQADLAKSKVKTVNQNTHLKPSTKKDKLENILSRKDSINNLFTKDAMFGLKRLEGDMYHQWLADIKSLVITLHRNALTESILKLVDGFNGWSDEKDFSQLCSELNSLNNNFGDYNKENDMTQGVNSKKIFIVHGHDNGLKQEIARYLERIDLEPIILHEQASKGLTVIEKIEKYTDVKFGIILYTPCDIGGKSDKDLRPRARQNVVFEHGYLIAKLGRENVCALVSDDSIEKPSDISGIIYISTNTDWKVDVAKELKECGYKIDMNKLY